MPEFGSPFAGLAHDRKLTHEELVRAIRFMIAAEYEAIQLYQQTAESTTNQLAKTVLIDIADEDEPDLTIDPDYRVDPPKRPPQQQQGPAQ